VYENFDSFKINDIVEFVGILSQDPSLAYMHDEHTDAVYMSLREQQIKSTGNEENSMETDQSTESNKNQQVLSSFPPSLVPRLNCIKSYHLIHNNPLLNRFDSNTSSTLLTNCVYNNNFENSYANRIRFVCFCPKASSIYFCLNFLAKIKTKRNLCRRF